MIERENIESKTGKEEGNEKVQNPDYTHEEKVRNVERKILKGKKMDTYGGQAKGRKKKNRRK